MSIQIQLAMKIAGISDLPTEDAVLYFYKLAKRDGGLDADMLRFDSFAEHVLLRGFAGKSKVFFACSEILSYYYAKSEPASKERYSRLTSDQFAVALLCAAVCIRIGSEDRNRHWAGPAAWFSHLLGDAIWSEQIDEDGVLLIFQQLYS